MRGAPFFLGPPPFSFVRAPKPLPFLLLPLRAMVTFPHLTFSPEMLLPERVSVWWPVMEVEEVARALACPSLALAFAPAKRERGGGGGGGDAPPSHQEATPLLPPLSAAQVDVHTLALLPLPLSLLPWIGMGVCLGTGGGGPLFLVFQAVHVRERLSSLFLRQSTKSRSPQQRLPECRGRLLLVPLKSPLQHSWVCSC